MKKYYRFSELDPRASILLTLLFANKTFGDVDNHTSQAAVEQLGKDTLILPDVVMSSLPVVKTHELDVTMGKSFLRVIRSRDAEGKDKIPIYHLHLESCSAETPDEDPAEEVRAVVDLHLQPRMNPVLGGICGVDASLGWLNESFSYAFPHMRLKEGSLRITRASDSLEIARELEIKEGALWMDHAFGGVVPRTPEEERYIRQQRCAECNVEKFNVMLDRCFLRIFNQDQDCISVTHSASPKVSAPSCCHAVVQCGSKREGYAWTEGVVFAAEPGKQYRSTQTGVLYSTEWKVRTPTHDGAAMELTLRAAAEDQEHVTMLHLPGYWEGVVSVEGMVTHADKTATRVTGVGYVHSSGRRYQQSPSQLFDALRTVSTRVIEQSDASDFKNWEALCQDSLMSALSAVNVIAVMHGVHLTDSERVVLGAMIGTYGYIFHHGDCEVMVRKALQWCQSKWIAFFGLKRIRYQTLSVRAFILRELFHVVHKKCSMWVPKEAVALDIAELRGFSQEVESAEKSATGDKEVPSADLMQQPLSAMEIMQLKALVHGTWSYTSSIGSVSSFYREQGVSVLMRVLCSKVNPTLTIVLNADIPEVVMTKSTILLNVTHRISLNRCTLFEYHCPVRGVLQSRGCAIAGGQEIYVETSVGEGVERVWYSFTDHGKTLVERSQYYRSHHTAHPAASFTRFYTISTASLGN